jgi:hypothetical protein
MALSAMDQYRKQGNNPFAPATINGGGAMDAGIPQIGIPDAAPFVENESTMDKIGDVAVQKGGDYAADKGGDMLTKMLAGGKGGGATATEALTGHVAKNAVGKYAIGAGTTTAGAGITGALTTGAAALTPLLPFVIGGLALKSFLKK